MTESERQIIVNHISELFAEYARLFAIDGNFDEILTQYNTVVNLANALGIKPESYKHFSESDLRRIRESNGLFCSDEDDEYYSFNRQLAFKVMLEVNAAAYFNKECYITLLASITHAWSRSDGYDAIKALYLSEYDKKEDLT